MSRQIPMERSLPHKEEILTRVLTDRDAAASRPWLVPVAAAASIAVVAGGLSVAAAHDSTPQQSPAPAAGPTAGPSPSATAGKGQAGKVTDVRINLGPVGRAQAKALAEACVARFGRQGQVGAITHAIRVKGWSTESPVELSVAALDKNSGLVMACVGYPTRRSADGQTTAGFDGGLVGGDATEARRYKSVVNPTDATHPAVPTDAHGYLHEIKLDSSLDLLVDNAWYRTDDRVAAIRQRYVIKGKPGPWYVADAVDGLVFLRSWDRSTALKKGDQVRIETQVLGHRGQLLDAPADQKGGGGLTPSPGTTRVDVGRIAINQQGGYAMLAFGR
jgi:hypothetical protein